MTRLTSLKPRFRALAPRLGHAIGDEKGRNRERSASQPWRAWYGTAEWKALRLAAFRRDRWTCQRTGDLCIGKGNATHKVPHRGDRALFFDLANIETVTKAVHDSLIQREERRAERSDR